jgi:hypothetical protein
VATVRIDDRITVHEFEGDLIASETTRTAEGEGPLRWADFEIYRHDDGGYVIHRIGGSRVYHTAGTACRTAAGGQSGDPATVSQLPDDAESCDRCQPAWPEDLRSDERVRFEFPRHTIDRCATPAEVISVLTSMKPRGRGRRTVVISDPVRSLLAKAAAADPQFADADRPVERI